MAVWTYECVPCRDPDHPRYVACDVVDLLPPTVRIVRIRTGHRWVCAVLRRERRTAVDGIVVRDVAATEAQHCGECEDD